MIKPAFVSIAAWGNKELARSCFEATATAPVEQAWNYIYAAVPSLQNSNMKIAVNSEGRHLRTLPKRKIWPHIKNWENFNNAYFLCRQLVIGWRVSRFVANTCMQQQQQQLYFSMPTFKVHGITYYSKKYSIRFIYTKNEKWTKNTQLKYRGSYFWSAYFYFASRKILSIKSSLTVCFLPCWMLTLWHETL